MKYTILFLAANPLGTDRLALDEECAAVERELRMTSGRDDFDFRSKWAVSVDELMRHLNELQPTILHFSGHGSTGAAGSTPAHGDPRRDIAGPRGAGIFLQDERSAQYVSERALAKMIASAAPSVRVVVLNACHSAAVAESLRHVVDCVVGMDGAIGDAAARSFAVAIYRALGNRRSVGNAVAQAGATLAAKQLPYDLLVCRTRDGLSADQFFLPTLELQRPAAEPRASSSGTDLAATSSSSWPSAGTAISPKVDIGIVTIRDDEFRAVLRVFPSKAGAYKGTSREYTLRHADVGNGEHYRVAVLRLIEQGNGEAQDAARDLIDDLAPRLVLVVGIAGGLPSDDVQLGDVVVSTRIYDFTVEARKFGQEPTYAVTGGPVDKALAAVVANLAAREDELGSWAVDLPPQPPVSWEPEGQLYGPPAWQRELRDKLAHHHGPGSTPRASGYVAGPIASSDRLVKDPELLIPWLQTARNLLAIEMESGGVYRAARERCPMLAIRGISDIVGLKRADAWTKYACASAAAFTRAFLRIRPIDGASSLDRDLNRSDPPAQRSTSASYAAQDRPLLDISYRKDHGWVVRNLGVAPATRGIAFESKDPDRFPDAAWEHPVRISALERGEERALRWLGHRNVGRVGIVYEDVNGVQYSSICHHDNCKESPGNAFPAWRDRDIGREWDI